MAGPTCEVIPCYDAPFDLNIIDAALLTVCDRSVRTRKGRVWDVWIAGRPIHVAVTRSSSVIELAAGCNGSEDSVLLRRLAAVLATVLIAQASDPVK